MRICSERGESFFFFLPFVAKHDRNNLGSLTLFSDFPRRSNAIIAGLMTNKSHESVITTLFEGLQIKKFWSHFFLFLYTEAVTRHTWPCILDFHPVGKTTITHFYFPIQIHLRRLFHIIRSFPTLNQLQLIAKCCLLTSPFLHCTAIDKNQFDA